MTWIRQRFLAPMFLVAGAVMFGMARAGFAVLNRTDRWGR